MSDRDLIERALKGDPEAERALYDAHVDRVFGLAYRMTGEASMAEDFTQDTFIRMFDRLDTFRGEAAFSTWLHSITMSVVLNGLRSQKRHRDREIAMDDASIFDKGISPTDPALKVRLRNSIDALSEGLRAVFVLHDVEGFKHSEIAKVLDMPVGTSKARLNRARAKLRDYLGGAASELMGG